jgi:hypothetical protein
MRNLLYGFIIEDSNYYVDKSPASKSPEDSPRRTSVQWKSDLTVASNDSSARDRLTPMVIISSILQVFKG